MRDPERRRSTLYGLAFVLLTGVGAARIVASSAASYQTHDEPFHIGCGMLWMAGEYPQGCDDQPPLARIAAAIPLTLDGARAQNFSRRVYEEGSAILRYRGS
jgi:hypothetical protein